RLAVNVSYTGLYRFVLAREWLPAHRGTVRMAATKPGEVVEVDFGYLGRIADATGQLRKAGAFSVVLPFSRHMHVSITFKQDIPAAIAAFEAPGRSLGASRAAWCWTTSRRPWTRPTTTTQCSTARWPSTASTAASSWTPPESGTQGTNPIQSAR